MQTQAVLESMVPSFVGCREARSYICIWAILESMIISFVFAYHKYGVVPHVTNIPNYWELKQIT